MALPRSLLEPTVTMIILAATTQKKIMPVKILTLTAKTLPTRTAKIQPILLTATKNTQLMLEMKILSTIIQ